MHTSSHFLLDSLSLKPKPFRLAFSLLLYMLSILIIFVNSCKVCVFYFCIVRHKLDLFQETCFIVSLQNILTSTVESFIVQALGEKLSSLS